MKLVIYSEDGQSVEEQEFAQIPVFEGDKGLRALKDNIVAIQAGLRQGNACTKTRGEVSGTGKKPWRQKGTGMARHGSKRSPIWSGGGVAHGPRPRNYKQKMNRKLKRLGLARALFDSATAGDLALINQFTALGGKTKAFNARISKIHEKGSILLVDEYFQDEVLLAARNIPRVYMVDADSLNAWDLVRHQKVLLTEKGLERLLRRING